jgi:hypothetical protein
MTNDSKTDITAWAYSDDEASDQDWDLLITVEENFDLILMLAGDPNCPHKYFFLHCLYLIVGCGIRSNWNAQPKNAVENLIKIGALSNDDQVKRWSADAQKLLMNPKLFNYKLWCDGGLAETNSAQS